jgi:NADPH-dependent 2,4-dienoyl-CoA reductase/sulfur reductase-like enzyme
MLRKPEFFKDADIDFRTNVVVTKVDSKNKKVITKDG